ncbi:MAG: hypothetical protein HDT37_00900 [Clostridiales bacterium]|nr:hypothetical protein [Clostridiales bacterium]
MNAMEIARRMAELDGREDACRAYTLALQGGGLAPEEEMEAALYILQAEGDYRVAYTCFRSLYDRGLFREDCLNIMTQAFYAPNAKLQKSRYEKNCKALAKYPYLFRKDFLDFDALPIRFYPFDDNGYLPFHRSKERFDDYMDFDRTVISQHFFHDLENPILAKDVYSQYELEYLNDNVRPSEWVARENHIYLHYTDWGTFCAHLQILNIRALLKDKKFVFLIGDEVAQYPIDFKARFGIDYSKYPLKLPSVREVTRLIWHAQLSSHNGVNFFNEIFDWHPNLICVPSVMWDSVGEELDDFRELAIRAQTDPHATDELSDGKQWAIRELSRIKDWTDKDLIVARSMADRGYIDGLDLESRIAPVLFLQPHFGNLQFRLNIDQRGQTALESKEYADIQASPFFQGFKYIKTFTPMRRITNSYGASVRFMQKQVEKGQQEKSESAVAAIADALGSRVLNRGYMIDPDDRLYADSVLVRFEDGKLNPKATFTALAAFLDLPYTESMTYCSLYGERDAESYPGNDLGFSPAALYRTYDEYANDDERAFIEYFMRDAYETYGYDFMYYDGGPVDEDRVNRWLDGFTTIEHYILSAWKENVLPRARVTRSGGEEASKEEVEWAREQALRFNQHGLRENWHKIAKTLLRGLRFVNKNGQPLHMMPKLELDPALLEQPLYH